MRYISVAIQRLRISIKAQFALGLASFTSGLIVLLLTDNVGFFVRFPFLYVGMNLLLRITVFSMRCLGKEVDI